MNQITFLNTNTPEVAQTAVSLNLAHFEHQLRFIAPPAGFSEIFKDSLEASSWSNLSQENLNNTKSLIALRWENHIDHSTLLQVIEQLFAQNCVGVYFEHIGQSLTLEMWNRIKGDNLSDSEIFQSIATRLFEHDKKIYTFGFNLIGENDFCIQYTSAQKNAKKELLESLCCEILEMDSELMDGQKFVVSAKESYSIKTQDTPKVYENIGYDPLGIYRFIQQI